MYYDRTVSAELRSALSRGGPFDFLTAIGRDRHLADLQLRGYPGKRRYWATLYCGLTKVLDLFERNGDFWLAGGKFWQADGGWKPSWETRRPAAQWWAEADAIAGYVDAAIRSVGTRFTNEGAIQAMLCTRASTLFSTIDREAVVGFENNAGRTAVYAGLQDPLHAACPPDPALKWFVPKRFGGELDLLAVDDDGRLLVVEVKPGSATAGITWAPLQAIFYAELFRAWSDQVGKAGADSLNAMLQQRVDLRLERDHGRRVEHPVRIVPVVAIGGTPKSPQAIPRLEKVRSALLAGGRWTDLEVWIVEESVARTTLDL
jgi:hypothetical protein